MAADSPPDDFKPIPFLISLRTAKSAMAILAITQKKDFVFWHARGTEFAFLKLVSIPKISDALAAMPASASDDLPLDHPEDWMDMLHLILSELLDRPADSDRVQTVIRRVVYLKQKCKFSNALWLYIVCVLATEPVAWMERGGFRQVFLGFEGEAYAVAWREIAIKMGLEDIPGTLSAMRAYAASFESEHAASGPNNAKFAKAIIAAATVAACQQAGNSSIVSCYTPQAVYIYASEAMQKALDLPLPSPLAKRLVPIMLSVAAMFTHLCLVPRKVGHCRTKEEANTDGKYDVAYVAYGSGGAFKEGYAVERLGPKFLVEDDSLGKLYEKTSKSIADSGINGAAVTASVESNAE
ncbi:hypothetical protein BASA62_008611 [Batrachochytrium salamandrivorans]|nr:hypothetical protein BASA62_008611 [Batrachochytrium salamandrivorans]